ncbi:MAG: hypothetical protein HYX97_01730 [Chloroflexi bacterium]|nr:hypothetical protein [Chloroflexota bacterium]
MVECIDSTPALPNDGVGEAELQQLLYPTIRRLVAQQHSKLLEELEAKVKDGVRGVLVDRVVREFGAVTALDLEDIAAKVLEKASALLSEETANLIQRALADGAAPQILHHDHSDPAPSPSTPPQREPPALEQPRVPVQTPSIEQQVEQQSKAVERPQPSGDEMVEGTVRLTVGADGSVRQVMRFVDELRRRPQFRLLRLGGNHKDSVDIWLGLREPIPLRNALLQMQGVAKVSAIARPGDDQAEPLIAVHLAEASEERQALLPNAAS